jgi:cyclic beta-1,2-glucan synthetase
MSTCGARGSLPGHSGRRHSLCAAERIGWTRRRKRPQDDELLNVAAAGIARLNRLHGSVHGDDRFLLLHRKRLWNDGEGRWMGWERKRGKLHEFNLLLRDRRTRASSPSAAGRRNRTGVRYVISLDADTRLPRGAALSLIGKMAHPLNQPVIDPADGGS